MSLKTENFLQKIVQNKRLSPLKILGGIVSLTAIGSFWYWNWVRSPEYALSQIQKAIEKKDIVTLSKYVDFERLSQSLANSIVSVETWNQTSPHFTRELQEQIKYYTLNGNFKKHKKLATQDKMLPKIYQNLERQPTAFQGVEYVKKQDRMAVLGTKLFLPSYDIPFTLEVSMSREPGYWQVFEFNNFANLWVKIVLAETVNRMAVSKLLSAASSQYSYHLEKGSFATHYDRLKLPSIFNKEDKYHDHQISLADSAKTILVATAKQKSLKSYIGIILKNEDRQGAFELIQICETDKPSQIAPEIPQIVKGKVQCPPGTSKVI